MTTRAKEKEEAFKAKDESHPVVAPVKPDKSPATHTVTFSRTAITPPRLDIAVGDTVYWQNADDAPHSVRWIAGPDSVPLPANSGDIRKDQSFSAPFSAAGAFEYACDHNPHMRGVVVVAS